MAIVLENGVSLPDIPEGVLDTHPYCCVYSTETKRDNETRYTYILVASVSEIGFVPPIVAKSIGIDTDVDFIGSMDTTYREFMSVYTPSISSDIVIPWKELEGNDRISSMSNILFLPEGAEGEGSDDGGDYTTFAITVWSNHDIKEVSSVDSSTGSVIWSDDIYFLDSTVTFPELISAPGTWFKGMADAMRNNLGILKRYTIDEMKTALESAFWMERLVVNCGPASLAGTKTEIQSDCEKFDIYPFKISNLVEKISLPNATYIGYCALSAMYVKTVEIPKVTHIGEMAFGACQVLSSVDLPVAESIGYIAFGGCRSLDTLILRKSDAICKLSECIIGSSVIGGKLCDNTTPISKGTGYIYVPSALIDTYKADTYWSTYANQFRAIEDYPDICGTT